MSGLPAQDGVRQFHHQLPPRPREQRSSESFRMKFKCESCRDAKRRVNFQAIFFLKKGTNCLVQCVRLNIEYKCDRCDKKDLPCSVPMLPNGTIHDFNTPIDFESNVVQETAGNPPGSSHDFALLPAVFDGTMHTAPFEPMQNNILEAIEEPRAPTDMPHSYHLIGPSPGDHEERYFVKLEKSIAPSLTSSDSSYRRFKMSGLLENPTYITFDLRYE